jgi:hypothetical protein
MWTPRQLLHGKIVDALFMGGFSTLQIQFLGWLNGTASALNRSRNPVLAAHTVMANACDPEKPMGKMLAKFIFRKEQSIEPEVVPEHDEADKMFDNLEWSIRGAITQAQMRASDYEDFSGAGVSDGNELPMTKAAAVGEGDEGEENSDE